MADEVVMKEMISEEAQVGMRPLNYQIMFDVEDEHWWYVGRRAIVLAQVADALGAPIGARASRLPESKSSSSGERSSNRNHAGETPALRLLDIGCGTGGNMDHLQRYGQMHGVDLSGIALDFSRRQRGHQRVMFASATELPFANESFDLVTALDVVEHLDDDLSGLREIQRVLRPNAPAVIFVPAFQSLWGPNDDQSGHKRRYRLPQLRERIEAAGLRIERISYANVAMFLPIWLGRKILNVLGRTGQSENRINHPLINRLLARAFASEAGWLRKHALPFGVSIICVVRK